MPVAVMTLRVDQELKDQLAKIGELRHTPMSKLVNQALQQFVDRETAVLEDELEASLADLRRYRAFDPDFEIAIGQAARAEAGMVDDPAEGVILNHDALHPLPEVFEVTARLRSLLK